MTRNLVLLLLAAGLTAQDSVLLEVEGDVKQALKLTMEDLAALPRAAVETRREGVAVKYEGVWLHELLKKAGRGEFKGRGLASYLIAEATDGYQVVYSLAEIDPDFSESAVLVADHGDGKLLIGSEGPLRLVAGKDKKAVRSVRMLKRIQVVMLRK